MSTVINECFWGIDTPIQTTVDIPDGTNIPELPVYADTEFLTKTKRTACGPDELPYWLLTDYAYDIASVITDEFNCSLRRNKWILPFKS